MKDQLSCIKCGQTITDKETKCLQCGGWIPRAQRNRRLGYVLIILGLFLAVMIGIITVLVAPIMLSAGQKINGSTFTGSPAQGFLILTLFGIIIVFGLMSTVYGIFQVVTGRRNMVFIILLFVLVFGLSVVMRAIYEAADSSSISNSEQVLRK